MFNQVQRADSYCRTSTLANEANDFREASRTRTVLRVVKVQSSHFEGLARLQNISDGGMMLRVNLPICRGDKLTVYFADVWSLTATVIWKDGELCGVQFDHEIDCAALLTQMAEQTRGEAMRPLRLSTDLRGVAYTEAGISPIKVTDLSQRGVKVQHRTGFVEGLSVKILLESGLERQGVVRWSNDGLAGIQLLEPVSLGELGFWKRL